MIHSSKRTFSLLLIFSLTILLLYTTYRRGLGALETNSRRGKTYWEFVRRTRCFLNKILFCLNLQKYLQNIYLYIVIIIKCFQYFRSDYQLAKYLENTEERSIINFLRGHYFLKNFSRHFVREQKALFEASFKVTRASVCFRTPKMFNEV